MSTHAKLTGKHQYVEFKEETVANRVKAMVEIKESLDASKPCAKGCYAIRNICCYDATRKMLANNSAIYRTDPFRYFREIEYEVKYRSFFRYHVSGEIKDDFYLSQMIRVAREVPTCQFLCFTKKFDIVNRWIGANGDLPSNLHVIFSEWRGVEIDNPHDLPTSRPVWPGEKVEGIWCGGNCTECAKAGCGCWSLKKGERVLFEAH